MEALKDPGERAPASGYSGGRGPEVRLGENLEAGGLVSTGGGVARGWRSESMPGQGGRVLTDPVKEHIRRGPQLNKSRLEAGEGEER